MISIEHRFFSLNRTLLLAVGLWPYKKSKLARFHQICCFSILASLIIFQLTTFVTSKCTTDFIIKIFCFVSACMTAVIKYNLFCVNAKTIKYLLEQLQYIWSNLKDSKEIAIVEKYGSNAKRYTTALTVFVASSVSLITITQLWPDIFHNVLLINKSRSQRLQTLFMTEYFVDQKKYFYLLLLHQILALCLALFTLVATGTMIMAYLQHVCGMFQLASYRIENAMKYYTPQDVNLPCRNLVYREIIRAVHIHQEAMIFSTHLASKFEISFMFMIIFGVLSLSLSIFRVFQIISLNFHVEALLMPLITIASCILYMFVANLVGQEITDHCNHVYVTAYKIQWYIIPLHTQKLIFFLLQRGNKTFYLQIGGLFVASLECFATLVNASVSYFTLMYSMN